MSEREYILLKTAVESGINSPKELANFMAQVSHESGNLKLLEENFNYRDANRVMSAVSSTRRYGHDVVQSAVTEARNGHPERLAEIMYGGRMGNNASGDGWKYHGRGFIQITGKDNYEVAAKRTGIDLINHPELASNPEVAARVAVDYWQHRVPQNAREDVIAATRAVNGGLNGLEDRVEKFEHYQRKLTPKYLEQLKNELSPAIQPNPFANPDNFGALETPSLSPVAQTIKQQCHSHVHGFCARYNQPWTEGMDNTYMALTVVAHEAKMSGVDFLGVSRDNIIHIEQVDRKGIFREAQISAHEAANIPLAQSQQRLAIVDQQMLVQEQQTINDPVQTQHKVHSGPKMG